MDQLKTMKEQLISIVQGQLAHTDCVDTKELGEAVDMIKDLAEAIYYCKITEAMEESGKEKHEPMYYSGNPNTMYYGGNGNSNGQGSSNGGNSSYYTEYPYMARRNPVYYYTPMDYREYEWDMMDRPKKPYYSDMPMDKRMMDDPKEGRAKNSRRMYMESKEMHKDANAQIKDLEAYMKDLGEDITEMIKTSTPTEKELLKQKLTTLASKIA